MGRAKKPHALPAEHYRQRRDQLGNVSIIKRKRSPSTKNNINEASHGWKRYCEYMKEDSKDGLPRDPLQMLQTAKRNDVMLFLEWINSNTGDSSSAGMPYNPERVLRDIQKPVELSVPKDNAEAEGRVPQTPVTAKALASLCSLIEQDAHILDEQSKQCLEKLTDVAQMSFAKCALLDEVIRNLVQQNNEAKRRKSSKSTVIGKAKIMS